MLRGRLDAQLFRDIKEIGSNYKKAVQEGSTSTPVFPAGAILTAIHSVSTSVPMLKCMHGYVVVF